MMKPIEEQIINNLTDPGQKNSNSKDENIYKLMQLAQEEPFDSLSLEFITAPALADFIADTYGSTKYYFTLWQRIVVYLHSKGDEALAQEKLSEVEEALNTCLNQVTPEDKDLGVAMLPTELANRTFMRNLYSVEDEKLSRLFLKYLPAPRAKIFHGQAVPSIIDEREQKAAEYIKAGLARGDNNLASVEHNITKLQRQYRAKKRTQENLKRLPENFPKFWKKNQDPEEFAREIIADANKPYHPKCDEKLAERIIQAAKKVELFSSVSHLTAATALESIFNDGLYGRRSLLQLYMSFKPAALSHGDIDNGDANVICLGANEIDPKSKHGIELKFDAKEIAKNNPCVFFKQRDLGFDPGTRRHVMIGDLDLYFSHTGSIGNQSIRDTSLSFFHSFDSNDKQLPYVFSLVKNPILIADNIKDMHQILTLNFFRFVDGLMNPNYTKAPYQTRKIYDALNKLSAEELESTLLEIGRKMTDTMEFNFYGAYKIDFSALLYIKKEHDSHTFTLDMPSFVDELKAGNLERLNEAMVEIPEIFNSYRFIDFLISKTNSDIVISDLQRQREKCTLPPWLEESSKNIKPS